MDESSRQSSDSLTKPAYRNLVAENDPAVSGPAFPFIAGLMQDLGGVKAGENFFLKLKANGDKIFQHGPRQLPSLGCARTVLDSCYCTRHACPVSPPSETRLRRSDRPDKAGSHCPSEAMEGSRHGVLRLSFCHGSCRSTRRRRLDCDHEVGGLWLCALEFHKPEL